MASDESEGKRDIKAMEITAASVLANGQRMAGGEQPSQTSSEPVAAAVDGYGSEEEGTATRATLTGNSGDEQDDSGADETDDVARKRHQTKWSAECASTLPNFELVRKNARSVEDWCRSASTILAEYWGPVGLMRQAIIDNVKLPEFQRASFDPCGFTIKSLLAYIATTWNRRHARKTVELVLAKEASETWIEFLDRLKLWTAKKGMGTALPDSWYLNQLRANTTGAADICRGEDISAEDWALAMDTELGIYGKPKSQSVNAVQVAGPEPASDEERDESVAAIRRAQNDPRSDHRLTEDSNKICYYCHEKGHIARNCPKRRASRGRGGRRPFRSSKRQ